MKIIKLLTLAVIAGLVTTQGAYAEDKMKQYGDAYAGQKGETVEVAYFDGTEDALVVVRGVSNDWDGKVLKAVITPTGTGKDYIVQKDGADYHMIVERNDNYELYLPGYEGNPIYLQHVGRESVQPLHILTQYKEENAKAE